MKYFYIIVVLLLIFGCSGRYKNTEVRQNENEIWELSSNGKPVDGIVYKLDKNGKLEYEWEYVEGVRNGIQKEWFDNSQLKAEYTFKEGKMDGIYKEWYPSGQMKLEGFYKMGKAEKKWRTWEQDGKLNQAFMVFEITESVNEVAKDSIFGDYYTGLLKVRHPQGYFITEINYENGRMHGIRKDLNRYGNVRRISNYQYNKLEGEMRTFFGNGKLRDKENFKNGVQDGISNYYYESGQLEREVIYEKGEMKQIKRWNQNGTLISESK
jgi:antitoxin component YwqK of YwqJK toxin-antitoxin module